MSFLPKIFFLQVKEMLWFKANKVEQRLEFSTRGWNSSGSMQWYRRKGRKGWQGSPPQPSDTFLSDIFSMKSFISRFSAWSLPHLVPDFEGVSPAFVTLTAPGPSPAMHWAVWPHCIITGVEKLCLLLRGCSVQVLHSEWIRKVSKPGNLITSLSLECIPMGQWTVGLQQPGCCWVFEAAPCRMLLSLQLWLNVQIWTSFTASVGLGCVWTWARNKLQISHGGFQVKSLPTLLPSEWEKDLRSQDWCRRLLGPSCLTFTGHSQMVN